MNVLLLRRAYGADASGVATVTPSTLPALQSAAELLGVDAAELARSFSTGTTPYAASAPVAACMEQVPPQRPCRECRNYRTRALNVSMTRPCKSGLQLNCLFGRMYMRRPVYVGRQLTGIAWVTTNTALLFIPPPCACRCTLSPLRCTRGCLVAYSPPPTKHATGNR
jgi:hypothetical protein